MVPGDRSARAAVTTARHPAGLTAGLDHLPRVVDVRLLGLTGNDDGELSPGPAAAAREHGSCLSVQTRRDLVLDDVGAGLDRRDAPDEPRGLARLERPEGPGVGVRGDGATGAAGPAAVPARARRRVDDPDRARQAREI